MAGDWMKAKLKELARTIVVSLAAPRPAQLRATTAPAADPAVNGVPVAAPDPAAYPQTWGTSAEREEYLARRVGLLFWMTLFLGAVLLGWLLIVPPRGGSTGRSAPSGSPPAAGSPSRSSTS